MMYDGINSDGVFVAPSGFVATNRLVTPKSVYIYAKQNMLSGYKFEYGIRCTLINAA